MEVVVEQDQVSRPVVTGALYGHAREEREAGALAMPDCGERAEATVANDEIEAERKGKRRLKRKLGFEPLTMK